MNRFVLKLLVALLAPAAATTASAQIVLEQQNAVYDVDSTYMRPGTYTLPAFADGSQLQLSFDYNANRNLVIVSRALISATGVTLTLPPPQPGTGGVLMCPTDAVEVCTQAREGDMITNVCECQSGRAMKKLSSGKKIATAKDDA